MPVHREYATHCYIPYISLLQLPRRAASGGNCSSGSGLLVHNNNGLYLRNGVQAAAGQYEVYCECVLAGLLGAVDLPDEAHGN